ncbi:MAG TPA: ABC transporter permease [Balneolaceae bacterium]|nr:ABC transporter permease [Balneolaceae bacterium]
MKKITNLIKLSFKSIYKNRMRSTLTSLGIIIGVSAVIIMVGIGEGSQQQIEQRIQSLGTNLLLVRSGSSQRGGVRGGAGSLRTLTLDDVEAIRDQAAHVSNVSPVVRTGAQVIGPASNWFTTVYGVSQDYLNIRDWQIENGESFGSRDELIRNKVALVGHTVAEQLFPGSDPVGERIRIQDIPFTIIGILKAKGESGGGQDQDDIILAPYSTVMYRLTGVFPTIDMINASATSTDAMQVAATEIEQILRSTHKLVGDEEDDFSVRTQAEITEAFTQTSQTLTMLLGSIAGVSLIVGGIGIMNIMLVSVTERTREIGIRLSVGARESDVLSQFLTEAVVLSFGGGLAGILVSFIATILLSNFMNLAIVIEPYIITLAFLVSGCIGVFFGFYPARKAAALNPIDALRYE